MNVVQCTLVHNSTKLESSVDLAGAAVVVPIRKLNHGNKCCVMGADPNVMCADPNVICADPNVMCADPNAQTRDSQQRFSNVRLAFVEVMSLSMFVEVMMLHTHARTHARTHAHMHAHALFLADLPFHAFGLLGD